jgi:hypothetical protein
VKGGITKHSSLNARQQQVVAMAHILRGGPKYNPNDHLQLDPQVFLSFPLSITNAEKKEYNKSWRALLGLDSPLYHV